jgi:hypothetical protein
MELAVAHRVSFFLLGSIALKKAIYRRLRPLQFRLHGSEEFFLDSRPPPRSKDESSAAFEVARIAARAKFWQSRARWVLGKRARKADTQGPRS